MAIAAVTHLATAPIRVAALRAPPIPGRAVRNRAIPPPRDEPCAAPWAIPIAWPPLPQQKPLHAAMAPQCVAQVHGVALRASPTISDDPFMLVQLPQVGFRGLRTV